MPKLPKGLLRRGRHYYARLHQDGRDRWRSLHTTEFVDACRQLRRLRNGELGPSRAEERKLTVSELGRTWVDTRIATARSPKGARMAATRLAKYINPFLGHVLIGRIEPNDIRRFRLWLEGRTLKNGTTISVQTVRHVLSDLRCLLLWCLDSGYIERTPFPRRILPRPPERSPKGFTPEEARQLRGLPEPYGFYLRFLLGTGIRWGEAIKARADHVENGMLVVAAGKNKRVRRVPLSPELMTELRSRIGSLVPLSQPGSFNRKVRDLSGIGSYHVHRCRHHYAIDWLGRGGNLKALSLSLGHGSISVTERYARMSDDFVRDEARRIAGGGSEL